MHWYLHFQFLLYFGSRIECYYSAVQHNMILHMVQQWQRQILRQKLYSQRHPIPRPHGQAMGGLLGGFGWKLTVSTQHCTVAPQGSLLCWALMGSFPNFLHEANQAGTKHPDLQDIFVLGEHRQILCDLLHAIVGCDFVRLFAFPCCFFGRLTHVNILPVKIMTHLTSFRVPFESG